MNKKAKKELEKAMKRGLRNVKALVEKSARHKFERLGPQFAKLYDLLKKEIRSACISEIEKQNIALTMARVADSIAPQLEKAKKINKVQGSEFKAKILIKGGRLVTITATATKKSWKVSIKEGM